MRAIVFFHMLCVPAYTDPPGCFDIAGVHEAVQLKYLKALHFGFSTDPCGENLLEEYVFHFAYEGNKVQLRTNGTDISMSQSSQVASLALHHICALLSTVYVAHGSDKRLCGGLLCSLPSSKLSTKSSGSSASWSRWVQLPACLCNHAAFWSSLHKSHECNN